MKVNGQLHHRLEYLGQDKKIVPARNGTMTAWLSNPQPSHYKLSTETTTYMCIVVSVIVAKFRVSCKYSLEFVHP
jgi:hypothetical protein